jgi:hypothetical protein
MEVAESAAGLLIYKELHNILKIISVGKCELYFEKYSYQ